MINDLIKYGIGIFIGFSIFDYFIKGEFGWSMIFRNMMIGVIAALLLGVITRYRKGKETKGEV